MTWNLTLLQFCKFFSLPIVPLFTPRYRATPNASVIVSSGLFEPPSTTNATLDVFNVTARLTTDADFRCLDQASALSAQAHRVFSDVWVYQFDRSYQTPGFDPNAPVCDAPKDEAHPNGDPRKEYFKCVFVLPFV